MDEGPQTNGRFIGATDDNLIFSFIDERNDSRER